MGRDLVPRLDHGGDGIRIALHRHRDAEDRQRQLPFPEHPHQPPEPGAAAVFVDRLHVDMAHALERLCPDDLRQERFGSGIAMKNAVLAAFLVVHHELDGDPGAAGPLGVGRVGAVADHVARVVLFYGHIVTSRPFLSLAVVSDKRTG